MNRLFKILYTFLVIGSLASNSAIASDNNSSHSFKKLAQSLCESAKTDQVFQLRSSLRRAKTHIRTIYPDIKCDGQSLLNLAVSNKSERVVAYLQLRAKPETTDEQIRLASAN